MKRSIFRFYLIIILVLMMILNACGLDNANSVSYDRRVLNGEIEQYLNSGYIFQPFWIDENNCLFAFSPLNIDENNADGDHCIFWYSVSDDKISLIFNGKLDGYFSGDDSFCCTTTDGVLVFVGNRMLRFNNAFEYLEEKSAVLEDGIFISASNDGEKAIILSNDKLYYTKTNSISNTIKAFDRYYGFLGNVCFAADGNKILQTVGTSEKTTIIDVFDIQNQKLSHLTCLDSLSEDDRVGIGLLYPYDETHVMLRINGAEFTNFHDTYVLVDYINNSCEVIWRTSNISEFPLADASGTWSLEKSESIKVNICPFKESKISVNLEETPAQYGGNVWINADDYSIIYLNRLSEDERELLLYISGFSNDIS